VAFALAWQLGAALLAVWIAFAVLFRMSSLASIAAALAAPPLGFYLLGNGPEAWALVPIALLLVWRHRANIQRLLAGTESKIGGGRFGSPSVPRARARAPEGFLRRCRSTRAASVVGP